MNFFLRHFRKIIIAAAFIAAGCTMTAEQSPVPEKEAFEWLKPPAASATGVVILIHGLNNRPEIMLPLGEELTKGGFQCLLLRLSGHRGSGWSNTDYSSAWKKELRDAVFAAKSKFPSLPVSVAAYSLGATVTLAALSSDSPPPIERAVFFAPVIKRTFKAKLVNIFLPLRFLGINLPSLAPEKWRNTNYTSLRAYKGLAVLQDELIPARLTMPLCFVLDPKDKLISFDATKDWVAKNKLSNIKIVLNQATGLDEQNHFLVDPEARGEQPWKDLVRETGDCLR